jgi:hypothetical protein
LTARTGSASWRARGQTPKRLDAGPRQHEVPLVPAALEPPRRSGLDQQRPQPDRIERAREARADQPAADDQDIAIVRHRQMIGRRAAKPGAPSSIARARAP